MVYLDDINITERYEVYNTEFHTRGYLKGYIHGTVHDKQTDRHYEMLYRVSDTGNGEDHTVVSIDYGWEFPEDDFYTIEKALKNEFKDLAC